MGRQQVQCWEKGGGALTNMGTAWQGRAEFSYVSWGVHGVGNTSHMGIALRNMAVACMCTYMHGDGAEGLL